MRLADGNGEVICRRHQLLEFTDRVSRMTSEQVPDPRGRWPGPGVNAAVGSGSTGRGVVEGRDASDYESGYFRSDTGSEARGAPMSIRITSRVWDCATGYAAGELLVLLALADFSDDDGLCWPSVPTIAEKSRLSTRQVYRVLDGLCRDGVVSKLGEGGGKGKTTQYRVHAEKFLSARRKQKNPSAVSLRDAIRRSNGGCAREQAKPGELVLGGEADDTPQKSEPLDGAASAKVGCEVDAVNPDKMSPFIDAGNPVEKHALDGAQTVTWASLNGDMGVNPILKNRQEPSVKQTTPPYPPLRGGVRAVPGCVSGALPNGGAATGAQGQPRAMTQRVMRECGFTDTRLAPVIHAALALWVEIGPEGWEDAAFLATRNFREYSASAKYLRYTWGPRKFFQEGHWSNPQLWPYDEARLALRPRRF